MKTSASDTRPRAIRPARLAWFTWLCAAHGACTGAPGVLDGSVRDASGADRSADAPATRDVAASDAHAEDVRADAGVRDAALDAGSFADVATTSDGSVMADVPIVPACDDGTLIDLNAAGTREGATTEYVGSNVDAPESSAFVPPPGCTGTVGYAVALRYTTGSRAHLRVSTDNPATDAALDTVVWVSDRCDPAHALVLACNDDADTTHAVHRSTLTTPDVLAAGDTVYIIVAGFDPPVSPLLARGAFDLTVTEVPDVAPGDPCDPAGITSACSGAIRCAHDPAASNTVGPPTCIPDGQWGGRCGAGNVCDTGLVCDALTATCTLPVPDDGACDPTGTTTRCSDPLASCVLNGTSATCIRDGAKNGRCRTTGDACDTGLLCVGRIGSDDAICRTAAQPGQPCDPSGLGAVCVSPDGCQPTGATSGACTLRYVLFTGDASAWVDACTLGNVVALAGDDRESGIAAAPIALPFHVDFFGVAQDQLWPAVDGAAVFGASAPSSRDVAPLPLPDAQGPSLLAPYRADLSLASGGLLCTAVVGSAPDRRVAVEWYGAAVLGASGVPVSFEILLEESTSAVRFVYPGGLPGPGTDGGTITGSPVGIQADGAREYALFRGPVSQGGSVRFVPRF